MTTDEIKQRAATRKREYMRKKQDSPAYKAAKRLRYKKQREKELKARTSLLEELAL